MKVKERRKSKKKSSPTLGVELETYSIDIRENRISRELHFPKRSVVEKGERFTRDDSIGSEFNSKPFRNLREALFLLKNSLRKYTQFRETNGETHELTIFPVGGWIDRFAGSHVHIGLGKNGIEYDQAKSLAKCLHDHLPFLMVLSGNSPVWREKITDKNSNRLFLGTKKYFKITKRGRLFKDHFREINFNKGNSKKPPTLEIRILDSSLPEYLIACLCVCFAITRRWMKRRPALNQSTHANYLESRHQAIHFGVNAKLSWANHWMNVPKYVDLFFRKYEEELRELDIPEDIIKIFKYLKKNVNQAELIRKAALKCQRRHHPTWQIQFAKKYAPAIEELLDGNTFATFAGRLGIKLPSIERTWLGKRESKW